MIIISEKRQLTNLSINILLGCVLSFVSFMTTQCKSNYPAYSPEHIDSLIIEFVSDGAEAMDIKITDCNESPKINFLYIDSIHIDNNGAIHCFYDSLVVEKPLEEYVYNLLYVLFVSQEHPVYVYYEYDEKLLKYDTDLGWLTINKFICGLCYKEDLSIYDVLRKGRGITDDGYVYQYSKQFKALIQYFYFILARHIGGVYYEDYLRELNERRENATKEVFIPDSIR